MNSSSVVLALVSFVLEPRPHESPSRLFGLAVCATGDVDGDGCADLAIVDGTTEARVPALIVTSGRDGTVLCESAWMSQVPMFGRCIVSFADLDADGVNELAMLARSEDTPEGFAEVWIVSPIRGEISRRFLVPESCEFVDGSISTTSDVDGDRIPELVVHGYDSASTGRWSGIVHLLSSRTGQVLLRLADPLRDEGFAVAAIGAGDVDGDGYGDLAITSCLDSPSGRSVSWISGRDGTTVQVCEHPDPRFGSELDRLGDFDGDGAPELLIGAPQTYGHPKRPAFACVVSPRTARTLRTMTGIESHNKGACVVRAGDLNSDRVDDVLMSAFHPFGITPGVLAFSGADGARLFAIDSPLDKDGDIGSFGWAVSAVGDTNGDRCNDFAVTTCSPWGPEWPDCVRTYSGRDGSLLLTLQSPSLHQR